MITPAISSLLPAIREFMSSQPIVKAWLFGSCSRGEETPTSDIDILVTYDPSTKISLMGISRITCRLSNLLGRKADIVEEGCLRSFAVASVNRDKILIYEREN